MAVDFNASVNSMAFLGYEDAMNRLNELSMSTKTNTHFEPSKPIYPKMDYQRFDTLNMLRGEMSNALSALPQGKQQEIEARRQIDVLLSLALDKDLKDVSMNHDKYLKFFMGGEDADDKTFGEAFKDSFLSYWDSKDLANMQLHYDNTTDERERARLKKEMEDLEWEMTTKRDLKSGRNKISRLLIDTAPLVAQNLESAAITYLFTAGLGVVNNMGNLSNMALSLWARSKQFKDSAKAGYALGQSYNAIRNTYAMEAGLASHEMMSMLDENGQPISDEYRRTMSNAIGMLNAVIEFATPEAIFGENFVDTAKLFGRERIKSNLGRIAVDAVSGAIDESLEEGLQAAVTTSLQETAKYLDEKYKGKDFGGVNFDDAFQKAMGAFGEDFLQSLPSMFVLGGLGGAFRAMRSPVNVEDAAKMFKMYKGSKTVPMKQVALATDSLSEDFYFDKDKREQKYEEAINNATEGMEGAEKKRAKRKAEEEHAQDKLLDPIKVTYNAQTHMYTPVDSYNFEKAKYAFDNGLVGVQIVDVTKVSRALGKGENAIEIDDSNLEGTIGNISDDITFEDGTITVSSKEEFAEVLDELKDNITEGRRNIIGDTATFKVKTPDGEKQISVKIATAENATETASAESTVKTTQQGAENAVQSEETANAETREQTVSMNSIGRFSREDTNAVTERIGTRFTKGKYKPVKLLAKFIQALGASEGLTGVEFLDKYIERFDDIEKVRDENGDPIPSDKRGATQIIETGKAVIYAGKNANFSTFCHEVFHAMTLINEDRRNGIIEALKKEIASSEGKSQLEQFIKRHSDKIHFNEDLSTLFTEGDGWGKKEVEFTAELFEAYLYDRGSFKGKLAEFFRELSEQFKAIYNALNGDSMLNQSIVDAYDAMFGTAEDLERLKAQALRNPNTKFVDKNGKRVYFQFGVDWESILKDVQRKFEIQQEKLDSIKEKAIANGTFMKAPNGKDSNLTEAQWLAVRTEEFKNWFGDWENDPANASKVVDENGEPLVVYHGTKEIFNSFKYNGIGVYGLGIYTTDNKGSAEKYAEERGGNVVMPLFVNIRHPYEVGRGQEEALSIEKSNEFADFAREYFSSKGMDEYAEKMYNHFHDKTYSIQNYLREALFDLPLDYFFNKAAKDLAIKFTELSGYDGVTVPYMGYFVPYLPNQLKSARRNSGTYSNENSDIYFQSDVGEVEVKEEEGTLLLTHSMQANKLELVNAMNGEPMPSMAVLDDEGLKKVNSFGPIVFVGDRDMVEEIIKEKALYNTDIWSPMQPSPKGFFSRSTLKSKLEGLIEDTDSRYAKRTNLLDNYLDYIEEDDFKDFKDNATTATRNLLMRILSSHAGLIELYLKDWDVDVALDINPETGLPTEDSLFKAVASDVRLAEDLRRWLYEELAPAFTYYTEDDNGMRKELTAKNVMEYMNGGWFNFGEKFENYGIKSFEEMKSMNRDKAVGSSFYGYYEAKPRKIYQLSDYKAVAVPSDLSDAYMDIIYGTGIDVIEYDTSNGETASSVIKDYAKKNELYFQSEPSDQTKKDNSFLDAPTEFDEHIIDMASDMTVEGMMNDYSELREDIDALEGLNDYELTKLDEQEFGELFKSITDDGKVKFTVNIDKEKQGRYLASSPAKYAPPVDFMLDEGLPMGMDILKSFVTKEKASDALKAITFMRTDKSFRSLAIKANSFNEFKQAMRSKFRMEKGKHYDEETINILKYMYNYSRNNPKVYMEKMYSSLTADKKALLKTKKMLMKYQTFFRDQHTGQLRGRTQSYQYQPTEKENVLTILRGITTKSTDAEIAEAKKKLDGMKKQLLERYVFVQEKNYKTQKVLQAKHDKKMNDKEQKRQDRDNIYSDDELMNRIWALKYYISMDSKEAKQIDTYTMTYKEQRSFDAAKEAGEFSADPWNIADLIDMDNSENVQYAKIEDGQRDRDNAIRELKDAKKTIGRLETKDKSLRRLFKDTIKGKNRDLHATAKWYTMEKNKEIKELVEKFDAEMEHAVHDTVTIERWKAELRHLKDEKKLQELLQWASYEKEQAIARQKDRDEDKEYRHLEKEKEREEYRLKKKEIEDAFKLDDAKLLGKWILAKRLHELHNKIGADLKQRNAEYNSLLNRYNTALNRINKANLKVMESKATRRTEGLLKYNNANVDASYLRISNWASDLVGAFNKETGKEQIKIMLLNQSNTDKFMDSLSKDLEDEKLITEKDENTQTIEYDMSVFDSIAIAESLERDTSFSRWLNERRDQFLFNSKESMKMENIPEEVYTHPLFAEDITSVRDEYVLEKEVDEDRQYRSVNKLASASKQAVEYKSESLKSIMEQGIPYAEWDVAQKQRLNQILSDLKSKAVETRKVTKAIEEKRAFEVQSGITNEAVNDKLNYKMSYSRAEAEDFLAMLKSYLSDGSLKNLPQHLFDTIQGFIDVEELAGFKSAKKIVEDYENDVTRTAVKEDGTTYEQSISAYQANEAEEKMNSLREEYAELTMQDVSNAMNAIKNRYYDEFVGKREQGTKWQEFKRGFNDLTRIAYEHPQRLFKSIGEEAYNFFVRDAWKNRENENNHVNERLKRIDDVIIANGGLDANRLNTKVEYISQTGKTNELTIHEVMGIYIYDKSALGHEKLTAIDGNSISQKSIDDLIGTKNELGEYEGGVLTEAERNIADAMINDFESERQRLADMAYTVYNKVIDIRDFYYPLIMDMDSRIRNTNIGNGAGNSKQVKTSMLRDTTSVIYKLDLNVLDTYKQAVYDHERAIAWAGWVKTANRIMSPKGGNLGTIIRDRIGKNAEEEVRKYISAIARPTNDISELGRALNKVFSNVAVAKLAGNLMTSVKQIASAMTAWGSGECDFRDIASSMLLYMKDRDNFVNGIFEKDGTMRNRSIETILEEVNKERKLYGYETKIKKIDDKLMWTIKEMDQMTACSVWNAVYMKQRKNGASEEEAVFKAQQVVQETQSTGDTLSLSTLQRNRNPIVRLAFMFTNDLFQLWNVLGQDMPASFREHNWKKFARQATGLLMVTSLMTLLKGGWLPEEDETYTDNWGDFARDFVAESAQNIPLIGMPLSDAISGWNSSLISLPAETVQLVKNVIKAPERTWDENLEQFYDSAASVLDWTAFPTLFAKRTGKAAFNLNLGYLFGDRWGDWAERF